VITGPLTADNLISKYSLLLGTCDLNPQKSRQALQELMLVLLLHCRTSCVGGVVHDGLFAGVPKGPAKDLTEIMSQRAGMLLPVVNGQRKLQRATGGRERGRKSAFRAHSLWWYVWFYLPSPTQHDYASTIMTTLLCVSGLPPLFMRV